MRGIGGWVGLESVLVGSLESEGGTGGWVGLKSVLAGLTEGYYGVCFSV